MPFLSAYLSPSMSVSIPASVGLCNEVIYSNRKGGDVQEQAGRFRVCFQSGSLVSLCGHYRKTDRTRAQHFGKGTALFVRRT